MEIIWDHSLSTYAKFSEKLLFPIPWYAHHLYTTLDTYENVILLGDFNMTLENKNLHFFADSFNLEHLIKKPTFWKK